MGEVVILGAYPLGPESLDTALYADRWTCWKMGSSSPRAIWKDHEVALREIIRRQGYLSIYPSYGQNLPIEYELRVKTFRVFDTQQGPPGETFPQFETETANTWLRYKEAKKLRRPIPRQRFVERPVINGEFGPAQPIGEAGWLQMWRTGLVFAELTPEQ